MSLFLKLSTDTKFIESINEDFHVDDSDDDAIDNDDNSFDDTDTYSDGLNFSIKKWEEHVVHILKNIHLFRVTLNRHRHILFNLMAGERR